MRHDREQQIIQTSAAERLEMLKSFGLTQSQEHVLRPRLELQSLQSYKIESIPQSDLKGLRLILAERNDAQASQLVDEEILREFPLVIVENIVLKKEQWKENEAFYANVTPQILHHDYPTVMGKSNSIGLYHPRNSIGVQSRKTPTLIADARTYWIEMIRWLKTQVPPAGEIASSKLIDFWDEVEEINTDPQMFLSDYKEEFDNFSFLGEEMGKWGIDPKSKDGLLIQLLNTKAAGLQDLAVDMQRQTQSNIFSIEWRHMMMVIIDNLKLVHARGITPNDNRWWPRKLEETNLVDTNLDYLEKAA